MSGLPSGGRHGGAVHGEVNLDTAFAKSCNTAFCKIGGKLNVAGWRNLCETLSKDMGIVRSQLKNMYLEICERQENAKMNSYILGKNKLLDSKINLIGMKKP